MGIFSKIFKRNLGLSSKIKNPGASSEVSVFGEVAAKPRLVQSLHPRSKLRSILARRIKKWLELNEKEKELPDNVVAICFGLFEGESTYQIYLIGSKEYDSENDDWACNQDFKPKLKYLNSGISVSYDWKEFQSDVCKTTKKILKSKSSKFLEQVEHVCVGFDSGSLEKMK